MALCLSGGEVQEVELASGTLQICVCSSFTANFGVPMISRRRCNAEAAQDHEVIGIGDKASAKTLLKAELLPPQHEPAHVKVRQPWGAHLCLFYETKQDLLEMVVPYLKAGFES